MFSINTLHQLIRSYGNAYQTTFSEYLQRSLEMFAAQQQEFQEQVKKTVGANPMATMNELTQRNLDLWRQVQNNFFSAAGITPKRNSDEPGK